MWPRTGKGERAPREQRGESFMSYWCCKFGDIEAGSTADVGYLELCVELLNQSSLQAELPGGIVVCGPGYTS